MNHFRLGAVSYMNTLPLVFGLKPGPNEFSAAQSGTGHSMVIDLEFDLPGRLADKLQKGLLDVALVPSLESFQYPEYTIVSDACIGCRGPVWSVKLLSRCRNTEIATLALDEGSRTSCALVRILLDQCHGVRPELSVLPIDANWDSTGTDAVLIIGDRAMRVADPKQFPVQTDLGQWWNDRYQLPFVFALWTARSSIAQPALAALGQILSGCRDAGLDNAVPLASRAAERYGLEKQRCLDYFLGNLQFRLGDDERAGLVRFRDLAAGLNLAPNELELQFHEP